MPAGSASSATRVAFLVRLAPSIKQRLTKLAFKRSWTAGRRCSENSIVEAALAAYLDTAEDKR